MLTTAHSRHDDIGDHEIDHLAVAIRDRLRLLAGPRVKHRVAVLPENLSDQVPDLVLIFDQEDRFRTLERRWIGSSPRA